MFAKAVSGTVSGFDGQLVQVEVDISRGLPMFDIVGLPDASMRESRDRVRAALRNGGFPFPTGRIVVNLAPADLPKTGPACDLAVALGILAASGQLPMEKLQHYCVIGELSLDGAVQPVPGLLPIVLEAAEKQLRVLTSSAAAHEASLVPGMTIVTVDTVKEAVDWLRGGGKAPSQGDRLATVSPASTVESDTETMEDWGDVKGQTLAKRALEIAAAGDHNVLLVGAPGIGKTMLARRLAGILPPLGQTEHLDVCRIYSVAGLLDASLVSKRQRPFRAPHHAATKAGMLGGARGIPGELSLAHHGVLFLDELNEFPRSILESLRQPLEDGLVVLARLPRPVRFPSRFGLVAAANPCPCGYYGDRRRECRCPEHAIASYRHKLSGPLVDRIDLYVEMSAPTWMELADTRPAENSATVQKRVASARLIQTQRFGTHSERTNGRMLLPALERWCRTDPSTESLLRFAADSLHLSARAIHRTLRVARTIADLSGRSTVKSEHVQEALAFRLSFADSSLPASDHMHLADAGGVVR